MREIQVVFGIDMETDIGSWTPFYEGVTKGTPLLLNLFAKKSIPVTAFWVADTARSFPEIVREMESAGHETGTHSLYHEFLQKVSGSARKQLCDQQYLPVYLWQA